MPRVLLPAPARRATQLGTAVKAVTRPAPQTLRLIRRRAQPTAVFIARLTVTAVLAYLVALWLPGSPRPLLAPLTALLVVQYTLYQTLRHAVLRVASVVAGVLVAVVFSTRVGFTWWSLGVTIAAALTLGHLLRLGEHILEVPISAMLVFSLNAHGAGGRIVETLVGAGTGLLAGLVASPVQVQPAEEAAEELARRMGGLLDRMADDLATRPSPPAADWLTQARLLRREIQRVEHALGQAEESLRLNPRATRLLRTGIVLRDGLETLEHAAAVIRVLAYSFADQVRQRGEGQPLYGEKARECLSLVLQELAVATRAYGRTLRTGEIHAGRELEARLAVARDARHRLAELLRVDPVAQPADWPLHAELLLHLNRLCDELRPDQLPYARHGDSRPRRLTTWASPARIARKLRHVTPRRRRIPSRAHLPPSHTTRRSAGGNRRGRSGKPQEPHRRGENAD